jgi:PAS domain S-box-containing protein
MERAGIREKKFLALRAALGTGLYLLELAVVSSCYFGLAAVAKLLPTIDPAMMLLWPPTGIALSLVLLRGYRLCPAILVGSLAANAVSTDAATTSSLSASASLGIATTLAASGGAWLINHWSRGAKTFSTPADVAKFALISIATALSSSAIALPGRVFFAGLGPHDSVFNSIAAWAKLWPADAAGSLIVAAVILLWATTPVVPTSKSRGLETAAIIGSAAALGLIVESSVIDSNLHEFPAYHYTLVLLILCPLTWAGLRGNQRDAATAALIFYSFVLWRFLPGHVLLAPAELNRSLIFVQALTIGALLISLTVGATIIAHRNAEAHLRLAQSQLIARLGQVQSRFSSLKRHFHIFVDGVSDYVIFVLDTSGHVSSWNNNAQKIIGYDSKEVVGKHFGILYRPDERRAGEPNRAMELAARDGSYQVEGWRVRKSGTPFFVTGVLTAIRDDDDTLIGFASIFRDATERRAAQEKLVEAREQLVVAQKMEAIGKLTGGIAHDFNNLLMIIGGNAQIFKRLLDPKLPQAIEAIQTAAKRGESLTRQLLTFSRRQHLSPQVVDLNNGISNMRTLIDSSLRGNIVYKEKIHSDIWPVKVDLAELELAIVNIAVNARDAMPNGGVFTLRVRNVESNEPRNGEHSAGLVALEFSDTGMGIPASLLSKIFDPFFTTKEVGKGTGLGLSQVYGFAHQAGGTVQVDSTVGAGTTIAIYLPSCADEKLAEDEFAEIEVRPGRPIVLVVDDSAEVAEVTSSLFEHLGYETVYRESAEAALKLLAEGTSIDLVFSDIVMPGTIDGVGLAKEVRARYPNLPVLLTTGYSDAAKAAPSDLRILHKPFDSESLRNSVQDLVQARAN